MTPVFAASARSISRPKSCRSNPRWRLVAGAGVNQVVANLHCVQLPRVDYSMESFRVPQTGYSIVSHLALVLQRPESVQYLSQQVVRGQGGAPSIALGGDAVVYLDEVHVVPVQACEALLHRTDQGTPCVRHVLGVEAELGAHVHLGVEGFQGNAQVPLGNAVAVGGSGVEVVNAQLHGPRHRPDPLFGFSPDHQPPHVAAPEAYLGHFQARAAQDPVFHLYLPPLCGPSPKSVHPAFLPL